MYLEFNVFLLYLCNKQVAIIIIFISLIYTAPESTVEKDDLSSKKVIEDEERETERKEESEEDEDSTYLLQALPNLNSM